MDQNALKDFFKKVSLEATFKASTLQTFHRCLHLAKEVGQLKLKECEEGAPEIAEINSILSEIEDAHKELTASIWAASQAAAAAGGGTIERSKMN